MRPPKYILPIIVISQFCCISLWFAGNGVMNDLITNYNLKESALSHLTSAVQLGFIIGTLIFAIFNIADKFSPSKVFFISATLGTLLNLGILWQGNSMISLLVLRFFTGFFLAGIYPVGMKISADYFDKELGKSLAFLVGALVFGTALPHFLKEITESLPWESVILTTSALAFFGGFLMLILVPDGPYRKAGQKLDFLAFINVFKDYKFRSVAFGYFGHMWELYTFWAFVPVMLNTYAQIHPEANFNIPLLSFLIIGIGGFACVVGGYLSQNIGIKRTAFIALLSSCICCLLSPLFFKVGFEYLFVVYLMFWGMVVIADSPMFSTLVAQNTSAQMKGTALTIVNCIGFSITIISIQLINGLRGYIDPVNIYVVLAFGPILGLIALRNKSKKSTQ